MDFIPSSYLTMLVLFLIGIFFCVRNFFLLHVFKKSDGWPHVMGALKNHRISAFMNTNGGKKTYSVRVAYEYTVSGNTYSSERLKLWSGDFTTEEEAEEVIKYLSSSPLIQVFYDPTNPAKAILLQGSGGRKYTLAFWGGFLVFISSYVVFSEWWTFVKWLSIKF